MAWYTTGTVAVTNGSPTVTGTGTAWFAGLQAGWGFVGPDGRNYEIASVNSDTTLTLGASYQGSTAGAQSYGAFPTNALDLTLVASLQTLIDDYQVVRDGPGQGKFPSGTLTAPGVRFEADPDTGMRRVSANMLALVAGGADKFTMTGNTAAGDVVQSGPTDSTSGRLMKVPAFGSGVTSGAPVISDFGANIPGGMYQYLGGGTGATDTPDPLAYYGSALAMIGNDQDQSFLAVRSQQAGYVRAWIGAREEVTGSPTWGECVLADGGGGVTIDGNKVGFTEFTVADDAVATLTPPRNGGFAIITPNGDNDFPYHDHSGIVFYDAGTSLQCQKVPAFGGIGTSLNVSTSDVTGTTGTDGGLTVAVQAGVLKIENRTGASQSVSITFL